MSEELILTRAEFKEVKLEALFKANKIIVDGVVIKDRYNPCPDNPEKEEIFNLRWKRHV